MGSGFKDFAAGDILTAADVDGYLMRQTVMTFADASARDSALSGVLDEGMIAYLEDENATTFYDGSAWKYTRSDQAQWMIGCTNGGGWTYNPADVSNGYYSPAAGATVTMTTGTLVLVMIHADWAHVSGKTDYWSVNVTGATTIAPSDANAIVYTSTESHRLTTGIAFCLTVNAGSNTFQNKMKNVTGAYAQTVYYNRLQIVRLN